MPRSPTHVRKSAHLVNTSSAGSTRRQAYAPVSSPDGDQLTWHARASISAASAPSSNSASTSQKPRRAVTAFRRRPDLRLRPRERLGLDPKPPPDPLNQATPRGRPRQPFDLLFAVQLIPPRHRLRRILALSSPESASPQPRRSKVLASGRPPLFISPAARLHPTYRLRPLRPRRTASHTPRPRMGRRRTPAQGRAHRGHTREKLAWPEPGDSTLTSGDPRREAFVLRRAKSSETSKPAVRLAAPRAHPQTPTASPSDQGLPTPSCAFQSPHPRPGDTTSPTCTQTIATACSPAHSAGARADNLADMVPITNPFLKELLEPHQPRRPQVVHRPGRNHRHRLRRTRRQRSREPPRRQHGGRPPRLRQPQLREDPVTTSTNSSSRNTTRRIPHQAVLHPKARRLLHRRSVHESSDRFASEVASQTLQPGPTCSPATPASDS